MAKADIEYCLSRLQPFSNSSNSFSAICGQINGSLGRLPAPWAERYCADTRLFRITYTVLSYETPIAWVLADPDGDPVEIVIPDVYYTPTTSSRHQSPCRKHLPFPDKHVTEL